VFVQFYLLFVVIRPIYFLESVIRLIYLLLVVVRLIYFMCCCSIDFVVCCWFIFVFICHGNWPACRFAIFSLQCCNILHCCNILAKHGQFLKIRNHTDTVCFSCNVAYTTFLGVGTKFFKKTLSCTTTFILHILRNEEA
jgi:hypothetical protein